MLETDNHKIGKYLSELIDRHYVSKRQFCKDYLKSKNIDANNEETRKTANRVSQILKGTKGIQIYDLPVFSELLDVSCEEILSAGTHSATTSVRITNYVIAHSKNETEWKKYIEREDKLILNPDEYGKTAIDYALECGNYDFLKYLLDNKYIWFDSRNDMDYVITFGAGTCIQRRKQERTDDYLQDKLSTEDKLRMNMVTLAIEHNDIKTLTELRARELPEMYYKAHFLSCTHPDFDSAYDRNMVRRIAGASEEIIAYFSDEFEIRDHIKYRDGSKRSHIFMFPYLSQLLNFMIDSDSPYLETALRKAVKHNKSTEEKLYRLIRRSVENGCYIGDGWKNNLDFYKNGDIISFRDTLAVDGIITNLIHTDTKPKNATCSKLTEELNSLYERISRIKSRGETVNEQSDF